MRGRLQDAVEDGGGPKAKERLKARKGELTHLEAQHAELQQRQTLAAFELTDGELEAVLAAMRADVQSEEVAVARRALSLFVRMVDAEQLVIWYHEPALVGNARLQSVPPRGFEHGSCDDDDSSPTGVSGTWLALVTTEPSPVWTDRTREIRKLREQGETLANIGAAVRAER